MNPARTRPVLAALNAAPGLLLLFVLAAFTAATPRFLEPRNLVNILVQSSSTGIVAVGAFVLPALTMRAVALLFLALALIGNHSEIVIRELQVILGLDAIAIEMGVLGQLAVFFQQLRRIAAGAAINAVELLTTTVLAITAAPPTVIPTSIVQGVRFPNARPAWLCRTLRPHDANPGAC